MNKSILVTGASTGLGLATSLYLARKGFRVYAATLDWQDRDAILTPAEKQGLDIEAIQLDITDPHSIDAAIKQVVEASGGIFGLVNSAGTRLRGCFEDLAEEEIRRLFNTNIFGTMAVIKAVLPSMRRTGCGRIVMITSVAGLLGAFGSSAYCASKFAQEGFFESLLQEVKHFGIDIIRIAPGIIKTEAWDQNRVVATAAENSDSYYADLFLRSEHLADKLVRSSPTKPVDVARTIYRAMSAKRPRYRYIVGRRARIFFALRRCLPGEVFERIYFAAVRRQLYRRASA